MLRQLSMPDFYKTVKEAARFNNSKEMPASDFLHEYSTDDKNEIIKHLKDIDAVKSTGSEMIIVVDKLPD